MLESTIKQERATRNERTRTVERAIAAESTTHHERGLITAEEKSIMDEQLQEITIPWDAPNPISLTAPARGEARAYIPLSLTDPRVNVSVAAGQSETVNLPNGRRVKITREAAPHDPSTQVEELVIPWNTANPHPLRIRDYGGPDWRDGVAAKFGDKTVEVPLEPGQSRLVDLPNGVRVKVTREAKPLPGATPAPSTAPAIAAGENAERPAHAREDFDRLERKP
jgi:hypothetical protein